MTDNADLIAELHGIADLIDADDFYEGVNWSQAIRRAADALAARDAACGRLDNQTVIGLLTYLRANPPPNLTADQIVALRAATFQVTHIDGCAYDGRSHTGPCYLHEVTE